MSFPQKLLAAFFIPSEWIDRKEWIIRVEREKKERDKGRQEGKGKYKGMEKLLLGFRLNHTLLSGLIVGHTRAYVTRQNNDVVYRLLAKER